MLNAIRKKLKLTPKLVISVLLIAVLFGLFWKQNANSVSIQFQDDSMTLSAPESDAFTIDIAYGDISSMELVQDLDLGSCVDGTEEELRKNGMWENTAFGQYYLCIYTNIPQYIVLHTTDGVVVFNYESEDTTKKLYEAFVDSGAIAAFAP